MDHSAPIEQASRPEVLDNIAATHVPLPLRVTAAWSWRLIVVGFVVFASFTAFLNLSSLLLPLIIALLIAAPLERFVTRLERLKIPRALGSALTILVGVVLILALITLAGTSIVSGFDDLRQAAVQGFNTFIAWLSSGPLHISTDQIDEAVKAVTGLVEDNALGFASSALGVTSALGGMIAGVVIALLALFFFMWDGRNMWQWIVRHTPIQDKARVDRAGLNAWHTLARYTQTSAFVALVDSMGIGLAAWLLGLPLALPIAILVFLFSFIPLFGATLSGAIAVLVALFDGGWTTALWMAFFVLLVQQIEGNILYPWLFGKAASIHPIVIMLTISAGTLVLGLVGAVVAVPLLAFVTAFVTGYRKGFVPDTEDPPISSTIPVIAGKSRDALRKARETMSHTTEIRVRKNRKNDARDERDGDGAP